jgi:hypothetical protein
VAPLSKKDKQLPRCSPLPIPYPALLCVSS